MWHWVVLSLLSGQDFLLREDGIIKEPNIYKKEMKNLRNIIKSIDREMGIIIALVLVVVLLYFVNFQLSNNLYINSLNISKTEQTIDTYRHENNALEIKYLNNSSYREISSEAATMGFRPAPFITP